eukprot:485879-Alexandrium_andersonii.AAC.1
MRPALWVNQRPRHRARADLCIHNHATCVHARAGAEAASQPRGLPNKEPCWGQRAARGVCRVHAWKHTSSS